MTLVNFGFVENRCGGGLYGCPMVLVPQAYDQGVRQSRTHILRGDTEARDLRGLDGLVFRCLACGELVFIH